MAANTQSTREKASGVYVANTTFATVLDGAPVVVHKGLERVTGDHPFVLGNPQYFDLVEVTRGLKLEQATAIPGQPRDLLVAAAPKLVQEAEVSKTDKKR